MLADRLWLSRSCNDLLAGAMSLIMQTVARFFAGKLVPVSDNPVPILKNDSFVRHYVPLFGRALIDRAVQKIRRGRRPFYWQVAYRVIDGPGIAETGQLDGNRSQSCRTMANASMPTRSSSRPTAAIICLSRNSPTRRVAA
ncbi:hypothetical protein NLY44_15770 [Mesorhizobium sp. C089B]|uniref:hypothetical protein n=1 Tax=Mesorhizobium sp. C089B TaxID=2956823 RepID=UPI002575F15A|nr:hypothetical protein [Mesorhizobium sp. C089B]WJI54003.1 hypothetical protein NLY44_15770 [Mesorhizobium sp. C089B]